MIKTEFKKYSFDIHVRVYDEQQLHREKFIKQVQNLQRKIMSLIFVSSVEIMKVERYKEKKDAGWQCEFVVRCPTVQLGFIKATEHAIIQQLPGYNPGIRMETVEEKKK